MAEFSHAAGAHPRPNRTVSIPYLVLSALLCGIGLFGVAYWQVTQDWLYFAGLIPLVIGAIMLFTRGTGADRA